MGSGVWSLPTHLAPLQLQVDQKQLGLARHILLQVLPLRRHVLVQRDGLEPARERGLRSVGYGWVGLGLCGFRCAWFGWDGLGWAGLC